MTTNEQPTDLWGDELTRDIVNGKDFGTDLIGVKLTEASRATLCKLGFDIPAGATITGFPPKVEYGQ